MKGKYLLVILIFIGVKVIAQKKVLDHTVYDGWQSIGEKHISNNGKYVAYRVQLQEGDDTLFITSYNKPEPIADYYKDSIHNPYINKITIPRGYNAVFVPASNFLICTIKPTYKEIRDAKIAKKKLEEMPKDSLAIVNIPLQTVQKIPLLKKVFVAEEAPVFCWLTEKANQKNTDKEGGSSFFIHNVLTNTMDSVKNVTEFVLNKTGTKLLLTIKNDKKDSLHKTLLLHASFTNKLITDTLLKNYAEAKNMVFDESGNQFAFAFTNDTTKEEQKKFTVNYYKLKELKQSIDENFTGIQQGYRVSENYKLNFSKNGTKLYLGVAPILPAKDTSLPEFERVNVDIWHYNEPELQTVQLKNVERDLKKSFLTVFDINNNTLTVLGNDSLENIITTQEGNGSFYYALSDYKNKVAQQWQGFTFKNVYAIKAGVEPTLVYKNLKGNVYPSYTGNYLLLYDEVKQQYYSYNAITNQLTAVAKDISFKLYDEENDLPDDANNYGVAIWYKNDEAVIIYDKYDMWAISTNNSFKSINLTNGRGQKLRYRYFRVDKDNLYLNTNDTIYTTLFDETNKHYGYARLVKTQKNVGAKNATYLYNNQIFLFRFNPSVPKLATVKTGNKIYNGVLENISGLVKAKHANCFIYTMENYQNSPNLYAGYFDTAYTENKTNPLIQDTIISNAYQLTKLNPQQNNYTWGSAALFTWKAYTGKLTEGILYKPENFDATKKYPMIVYFYERNNQTLHNYIAPSPTPSRLNISFFVSRGYVVFVPDIWYTIGKPGKSAYDYIVSGTRALIKLGFIDSTKIGLQGQSWGGYQTAYLITQTNLYKAAWAGAPVANMTSAYGGIRWGTGLNRQFQYEKTQSRIGKNLWQAQQLYIENSPLFYLPKVNTPLVIMHNDKDDAVPWYQGIELFTGLRRLGKPVWLLNYNNDLHNLAERKNRKDIQIREQQFFDWLLKGEKPAPWLEKGVPAIMKGRTWGL